MASCLLSSDVVALLLTSLKRILALIGEFFSFKTHALFYLKGIET